MNMERKHSARIIVASGTIFILLLKTFIRPQFAGQHGIETYLMGITPNLLGSFLLNHSTGRSNASAKKNDIPSQISCSFRAITANMPTKKTKAMANILIIVRLLIELISGRMPLLYLKSACLPDLECAGSYRQGLIACGVGRIAGKPI